jgi:hypothetical protein
MSDTDINITVNEYLGPAPAHTAYLGAQAEQSKSVIYCASLSTGVQQPDDIADLSKVMPESASPNLDRTPGVVAGRVERFGDIGMMVTKWERMDQDDNEWKAEEGMRRGNRKLSRRMSELLGIFGEGEKVSMVGLESGVTILEDNSIFSLPTITLALPSKSDIIMSSLSTEKQESIKAYHIGSKMAFRDEKTLSAGCDWPVVLPSNNLTTNRKQACKKRKRVTDWESEREVDLSTKRMRGNWSPKQVFE